MAVLNKRFPDRIAYGATGGHAHFLTQIVGVDSGRESVNQNWSLARGRWNVSQGVKDTEEYETARNFLYMTRGRFHKFRFKDWKDYQLVRAESRLVEITTTTFQLAKVYGDDVNFEYVRSLKRIVAGTQRIWKNGTLMTEAAGAGNYTFDDDTGIVTFGTAPGSATLEATCEFDVLCRFDIDGDESALILRRPDGTILVDWDNIDIVEVRE
jgi:uncharacterized protein (TIGR02217 family)